MPTPAPSTQPRGSQAALATKMRIGLPTASVATVQLSEIRELMLSTATRAPVSLFLRPAIMLAMPFAATLMFSVVKLVQRSPGTSGLLN